jgi:hypothetical protein
MSWDVGGTAGPPGGWEDSTSATPVTGNGWNDGGSRPGTAPSGGPSSTVAAPLPVLAGGLLLAIAGMAVGLGVDSASLAVVGWTLAGPLAVGAFGVFLVSDVRRRAQPMYAESSAANWARRALIVLATAGVALNAWTIADALARGTWT